MKKLIGITLMAFAGCMTVQFEPQENRKVESIREVKGSQEEIYNRGLLFWAKSINRSVFNIDIRDQKEGRIVGKIKYYCSSKVRSAQVYPEWVKTTFDMTARSGKYRIRFEDVVYGIDGGQYGEIVHGPVIGQMEKIRNACVDPLELSLYEMMKRTEKDDF